MSVLHPGIHLGVPDHVYHSDPCERPSLSSGIMHRLLTMSPLHARVHHPRLNNDPTVEQETTEQLDRGQLAHAMLLGGLDKIIAVDPEKFPAEKTGNIPDGWTNKAIRAERDRIRAEGKVPVFRAAYDEAFEMALRARRAISQCEIEIDLDQGDAETTIVWEEGKILCRARPDWMSKDRTLLMDYKSTAGVANPDLWIRRQMLPLGYGLQSSHYRRGVHARTGARPQWVFCVQENFPPFAVSFVGISESLDEIVERQRQTAYELWRRHIESNDWPGYSTKVAYATPTNYLMEEHERSLDELLELGEQG